MIDVMATRFTAKDISHSFLLSAFLFFGSMVTVYSPEIVAAPGGGGGGVGPVCPPACPPNPANCDANLVIIETQNLQFGSVTASVAGTVIVDTASVRSASGGVVLVGAGGAAGSFSVSTAPYVCTGRALATVTAGPTTTLTHASLPATMTVGTFTTNPVSGGAFDSAVPLTVGATLSVNTLQEPGLYTGAYSVTVTFQ